MSEVETVKEVDTKIQKEFESTVDDTLKSTNDEETERKFTDDWMIKPCVLYKEEYDECTSMKGRFHQYFIFGNFLDCSQWKTDYKNCKRFKETLSEETYNALIKSEKERRMKRLRPHYTNNVWPHMDKPPANWNDPLPKWLIDDKRSHFLETRNVEVHEAIVKPIKNSGGCTIL